MLLKNIQTQLVIKWDFLKPLQILGLFQLYLKTVFKGPFVHILPVNRNCILSAKKGESNMNNNWNEIEDVDDFGVHKNEKQNLLTVTVKATEIDEVKDIITSFIFMLEDSRIDYKIRQQYLESCSYLKENYFVNLERD